MTPRIPMQTLLDALAQQGLTDANAARRALRSTLSVVGERLVEDEAKALAEVLPAELSVLIEGNYDSSFDDDELFERVRRREDARPGRAREDAEIVLAVVGEQLDHDRRVRIARGLPGLAGELLRGDRELGEPAPHRVVPHDSSLASARPGSTHPVSEAAPPAGHTHSVATNPSPHEETKLSGAKGLTQERLDDTLAAGRPRVQR